MLELFIVILFENVFPIKFVDSWEDSLFISILLKKEGNINLISLYLQFFVSF